MSNNNRVKYHRKCNNNTPNTTNNKRGKYQLTCNNNTPNTNNKRAKYRHFDEPIKLMRQIEIRGYAIRYLDNVAKNNGKCKYGFMAGMVLEASTKNNALQIDRTDILNEARRIVTKQRKLSRQLSGTRPDYFLYRMGVTVPKTVTHVCIPKTVKHLSIHDTKDQFYYLFPQQWVHAFENCMSLIEVVLHEGVKTIGFRAFAGCSSLPHIVIPSSVTSISDGAFCNCVSLATIVLNNGLQRIGDSAFNNCTSLQHIIIPPSVTTIDVNAFLGCINLVTVVLHEGLQKIERSAFCGCRSLQHIHIPTTVTSIGDHAFRGCAVTPHLN